MGSPDAKLTVVEFIDFGCGHCAKAAPVVKSTVERYKDDVRLFQRHYPIYGCELGEEGEFEGKGGGEAEGHAF